MAWDVLSGAAKMAWDVLSGVTKTAWDVLSRVANRCGMFCLGCQKWQGIFCPGMFCPTFQMFRLYRKLVIFLYNLYILYLLTIIAQCNMNTMFSGTLNYQQTTSVLKNR